MISDTTISIKEVKRSNVEYAQSADDMKMKDSHWIAESANRNSKSSEDSNENDTQFLNENLQIIEDDNY